MIDLRSGAQQYTSPYAPNMPAQMTRGAMGPTGMSGAGANWNGNGGGTWNGNGGGTWNGNGGGTWNGNAGMHGAGGTGTNWNGGADGMETEIAPYMAEHMHTGEENGLTSMPQDDFDDHLTADEAARNSWRALLARNIGRNVIVSFLLGTQNTVVAEGKLYEVGTDYLVIYQPAWESHITADLYSVKFVEFREPPNGGR